MKHDETPRSCIGVITNRLPGKFASEAGDGGEDEREDKKRGKRMLPPKMNRLRMTQLERDLAHECRDSHISGRLRKRAVWTGRRVLREYDRAEALSESCGR
jgi:hypothetical protein